jgi:colicin import membrane protein
MLKSLIAPTLLALIFHGLVGLLLFIQWPEEQATVVDLPPMFIAAQVVKPAKQSPAIELPKAKPAAKPKSQPTPEVKAPPREEPAKPAEPLPAENPVPESEPLISDRENPEPEAPEAETELSGSNDDLSELLAAVTDEIGRQAITNDEQIVAYIGQIQRDIINLWSRPPSARNGMEAVLRVQLVPTGEVVDVTIAKSSGNDAFDRSATTAVERAERFSVPPDSELFEANFRSFTVLFRPEDLRL